MYDGAAFGALTANHANSVSPSRSKRSHSKSKSPGRVQSDHKQGTVQERVHRLENQMRSVMQGGYQRDSLGTPDRTRQTNIVQLKEDLNNFAQEVDRQMREVETRVVTNLSQHIEEGLMHTNTKVDEALLMLDQKVAKVEQMNSAAHQRANVIQST